MHYFRKDLTDAEIDEKLDGLIDKTQDCWAWHGYINKEGRAIIDTHEGARAARRYVYSRRKLSLTSSMFLKDTCGNPGCVNPDHMQLYGKCDPR